MVLPRAFSHGKWNEKSRTEGDLLAPEHREYPLVPSMMCYKHGEDEVKLERGLRVWKMEDICFIFFKVESESGGFQIKSSL